MTTHLKVPDVEPTVFQFLKQDAIHIVMEILLLSIGHNETIFSFFRQGEAYRPDFCQTRIPGLEKAPYKARCDGVTPTYNIPELAIVVACQLCFGNYPTSERNDTSHILLHNYNIIKRIKFPADPSLDLMSVLKTAALAFGDTDPELCMLYPIKSMDTQSFEMRAASRETVQYMIRKIANYYSA